jgi:hypothetical protein
MDILLQVWGGCFYLFNKILFSISESKPKHLKYRLQLFAWSAYIVGVPAWVVLLIEKNDWIAASIEAGGLPAMLLGLFKTYSHKSAHTFIETFVKFITYFAIVFGVAVSLQHFGGLTSLSQGLEIFVTFGFLMGSYLMTQQNNKGYLFFMLMNSSMAMLMFLQGKNILIIQQLISLGFVIYGYHQAQKHKQNNHFAKQPK